MILAGRRRMDAVPETTPKLTITMDRHLFITGMVREGEPK